MNGHPVSQAALTPTTPFITAQAVDCTTVDVHDWVGRLHFTSTDGRVDATTYVFPAKLAPAPWEAFMALSRIVDSLPNLTASLGYPTHLVPKTEGLSVQPLTLADVEGIALGAWRLTEVWRRLPRWSAGTRRRVTRGGSVPDRVDWQLTLDHWGRGGFPDHMARYLPYPVQPAGLSALRDLWQALAITAAALAGGEHLRARVQGVLNSLPEAGTTEKSGQDVISREAQRLRERLSNLRRQARDLPSGHVRMPDLYELWVQASLLHALDATDGTFVQDAQGLYTGTFRGPGVTVTLNPRLGFRGVGQGYQQMMPDLLAVFDNGAALVADVKYRALDRLSTEQIREVNRQLLGYMGLTHAAAGLVLWPAANGEVVRETPLPGGRARLLRLRCHPLDPPNALLQRLRALNLPGVQ
ncbi:hypothetical protein RDMS_05705 [Deinococcus sp. RL]|nr:hypothetical protein RDMS_05705 [Deinococcus sp. RL]